MCLGEPDDLEKFFAAAAPLKVCRAPPTPLALFPLGLLPAMWLRLSCRWSWGWMDWCRELCALPRRDAWREPPRGLAALLPARGECLVDLTLPSSECMGPPSSRAWGNRTGKVSKMVVVIRGRGGGSLGGARLAPKGSTGLANETNQRSSHRDLFEVEFSLSPTSFGCFERGVHPKG